MIVARGHLREDAGSEMSAEGRRCVTGASDAAGCSMLPRLKTAESSSDGAGRRVSSVKMDAFSSRPVETDWSGVAPDAKLPAQGSMYRCER